MNYPTDEVINGLYGLGADVETNRKLDAAMKAIEERDRRIAELEDAAREIHAFYGYDPE